MCHVVGRKTSLVFMLTFYEAEPDIVSYVEKEGEDSDYLNMLLFDTSYLTQNVIHISLWGLTVSVAKVKDELIFMCIWMLKTEFQITNIECFGLPIWNADVSQIYLLTSIYVDYYVHINKHLTLKHFAFLARS